MMLLRVRARREPVQGGIILLPPPVDAARHPSKSRPVGGRNPLPATSPPAQALHRPTRPAVPALAPVLAACCAAAIC
jgi:hypothetical protein